MRAGFPVVGAPSGKFSFRIGTPALAGLIPGGRLGIARQPVIDRLESFRSRPDLLPAAITVTTDREPRRDGDIFVDPLGGSVQVGPMILDPAGRLVWFDPIPVMTGQNAFNLRVQSLFGQPVLTWWQGTHVAGNGTGEGVILNRHYQRVATVKAGNGLWMDQHEFLLTPQGDAYIVATSLLKLPQQTLPVLDDVIQEIDIRTGLVLFEWNPLDHLPLSDSYSAPGDIGPFFDPYHINSIALEPDGDLIVSMRDTSAVYEIDRSTGAVRWRLGGKRPTFLFSWGARFANQHDATIERDGLVSMYDDNGGPPNTVSFSRGLTLELNVKAMTARLDLMLRHVPSLSSEYNGSMQVLGGGEAFISWGDSPYFSEDDASGRQDFDAHFDYPSPTYRAFRFSWSGQPKTTPSLTTAAGPKGTTDVYASWNGATDVARWIVVGGLPGRLHPLASRAPTGFETTIPIAGHPSRVAVEALDARGGTLGTSRMISVSG